MLTVFLGLSLPPWATWWKLLENSVGKIMALWLLLALSVESLTEHCSISGSIPNLRRDSCSCVDNSSSEKCTELLNSLRLFQTARTGTVARDGQLWQEL
ncbi:hypothetical protein AV530_014779 [Patagioenas fasciata monilis]|uniref:Uncharacterized protein n=1 Tax=Patagioenas fasciata monilis TaxID=372326 RepID=A0A1V4L002_PATFA|nr:hypothetical protein AV530_014779 [Patagioenas fasciata monilis]